MPVTNPCRHTPAQITVHMAFTQGDLVIIAKQRGVTLPVRHHPDYAVYVGTCFVSLSTYE